MALETRVTLPTLHENPFDSLVVWEKRSPLSDSKHRERTCQSLKTISTIVLKDGDAKEEYTKDYCVLVAATKDPSSQHGRPVVLTDRDHHYSTTGYNTFAKTHTSGPLYVDGPAQPVRSTNDEHSYGTDLNRFNNEEDAQLFCCNRDVDCIIDYATCMCCVKGTLYHFTKDSYDEGTMAEGPCTCEQDPSTRACISRWACMILCSIFLPCLVCYPLAKGCSQVCTCYKQHQNAKRQRGRTKHPRS